MGQYHMVVNLDKHQFLMPHKLGDGLKLWEQAASGPGGTASALIVLLAVSNGRGGGDFDESELVGSWGGDRIAIVGDYAEPQDLPPEFDAEHIYALCSEHNDPDYEECPIKGQHEHYRDISADVRALLSKELRLVYEGHGWLDRRPVDGEATASAIRPDMVFFRPGNGG